MDVPPKINKSRFYSEWKGHPYEDLATFHSIIQSHRPNKPIIYLAGDSSLDNKYWVSSEDLDLDTSIPEIYQVTLDRVGGIKPDVAFWLNHQLGEHVTTINCAVEASMLRERDKRLLEHDMFIRDQITSNDVLIVSVGGNDIAMKPTVSTALYMLLLSWFTPRALLERGWGLGHFVRLFRNGVQEYISKLVAKEKPRAVIVCMIYYPLEESTDPSWADLPLKTLGYNSNPGKLQTAIRKMFELATMKIEIPGTEVIPCPLFRVLDSKESSDYVSRVEPSADGGRKMAAEFVELLKGVEGFEEAMERPSY